MHPLTTMSRLTGLCLFFIMVKFPGVWSQCNFPEFLQNPSHNGHTKPWSTRVRWLNLRHLPRWTEKQDVFIRGDMMWQHRDTNFKTCHKRALQKSTLGQCSERELVYNRTCLSKDSSNKFRVVQRGSDRKQWYTCMKFVRRSENVVQVFEGPISTTNDSDLCDDDRLELDEWPWIAPWTAKPHLCQISGGFTFRTFSRLTNEDVCEDEWRRSHLEIECLRGDGLDFIAPKGSHCNPLLKHGVWRRLTCWAGWENNGFIFIVASVVSDTPKYCLRFPKYQVGEFSVMIYFSVVCPEEPDAKPPSGIEYYEMRMRRRDPNRCEDDDDRKCRELKTKGLCGKDINITQHCKKSCNMCQSQPRSKCRFNAKVHGDWVLYDEDRNEDVAINYDLASFSNFGSFACREMGTNENQYKTVSQFTNGCSPRYTCIEFHRRNNNVLQYRISKSMRADADPDELCTFHEDPFPLGDRYRSSFYKNLVLSRQLWPSYCGLDSTIPFNGTINGERCEGTVSDWDEDACMTKGTIILRSHTCSALMVPMEFKCLVYIREDETNLQQLLLTKSMDGRNEFNCWIITSYVSGGRWPWRAMYRMPNTQCSLLTNMELEANLLKPKAKLYLEDRSRSRVCKPAVRSPITVSADLLTITTDRGYYIRNGENQNGGESNIQVESPNEPAVNHIPSMVGSYGGGTRHLRSSVTLVIFMMAAVCAIR